MAKKERFRRRERTAEDIRRKASEGARDYDKMLIGEVKSFRPKDGENNVRILPATWGFQPYTDEELEEMSDAELEKLQKEEDDFGNGWDMPLYVHYGVGPDNASYLCREKMLGERCAVCDAKADSRDPDEADALAPTKRGLCWIVDRDAEKEGPQVWSMPWSKIRNEVYARSVDKKHGTPIFIDDEVEGFDVFFRREGKDERTNYTAVEIDRDATPVHDDERTAERWLDYIMEHRLPDVLNFYDYDHIQKVLFGRAALKRDDEDEGTTPASGRRSSLRDRRRGRGAETVPDEEADYRDDPDEEEEEEAEAAPAGRSRTRRTRSAPVEDDEEEREPARSTRRRTAPPVDEEEPDEEEDDPLPDEEEDDQPPEDQARSRLRGLRSRRGRK